MLRDFYRDKRVLITGDTGFKGSWLAVWLKGLGAEVTGYSLEPPSKPSNFESCSLQNRFEHIHGDIRDKALLRRILAEKQPEIVFHLAAQSLVRLSYDEPERTFETNAAGTNNLLEAVRLTPGVRVVVNVTSDKCYENREWVWGYRESDPLGGRDPYSASKACAEIIFSSYLKSFFNRSAIGAASVRAGNVIGGGDWGLDRLVPDCIRALSTGEAARIRMAGAVRPWQHVLEPLSGYLQLGMLLWHSPQEYGGPWNFGPGPSAGITVKEIVERLIQLWGGGRWEEAADPDSEGEASTLTLCCDKANHTLGWRCLLQVEESLALTVEWYKKFYSGHADMYEVCCRQIREYSEKARTAGLPWAL